MQKCSTAVDRATDDAAPLECPHCRGFGTFRGDLPCDRCRCTGLVRCETRACREPAVRTSQGDDSIALCEACGVVNDADVAAYLASLCSAGRDHKWLAEHSSEQEWAALAYVGMQSDEVETLELRNCACHSTLARVVARVVSREDGAGMGVWMRDAHVGGRS